MRMSCNGCRVLRKGCSEDCTIRPCLQWITSPDSQANATIFLAKFYGRAGLQNLINAGPDHLRPAIFRSLLYEACGRIVNPIYGSAGLLWSGNWHLCHAAVEAVLSGAPIVQIPSESAVGAMSPPLKAGDIRHVSKEEIPPAPRDLHKVKARGKFKRAAAASSSSSAASKARAKAEPGVDEAAQVIWSWTRMGQLNGSVERESEGSQPAEQPSGAEESGEGDCVSVETVEATLAKGDERADGSDIELELSLGLEPAVRKVGQIKGGAMMSGRDDSTCNTDMVLDCHL